MNKNLKNMIIVFIGFFFLSLFSNTLSPFITTIKSTYGVSNDLIAILPPVVYCSSFIMSIVSARLQNMMTLKRGLHVGFLFAAIASIVILVSKSFYVLLVGYFISGLAVGMGTVFLTTTLSLLPKEYQKFSLGQACFGLGGILILPIDRFILKNNIAFNYTYIIHIICVIAFIIISSKVEVNAPCEKEDRCVNTFSILRNPLVLLLSLAIFFYVGAEISTTNWTGTFLESYYGLTKAEVPGILSSFWILFTVGRAMGDKILEKVGTLRFLSISPLVSILGIFIILSGNTKIQSLIGIAVIGLSMSLVYPAIQGYVIQHVDSEYVPAASAIVTIFNNLGATFLTYIIGFAGGIKVSYVFIIQIFFYAYIFIVALHYLISKTGKRQLS
ncbi:major facilitator superfamily [Clostridium pasteurianum DSM 525 = ATCC 6013]|uniref:Major facilitator superfamily n=1 Tax=Clostridium pasteurianum DSM 525 = ATCC 6013 TaxID=1262449 RepID=A0A0H3J458_CLOPA|nr:MFS transporter [Clostridium pasteurianum]AJA48259.1 major facilitator superfamily [Clostridium pasteurianum DSM 525 = ATCC 6013]AJA52247.1 major facilitator superfamily [Clostridium pasteurianum DSM 525 = ATCC 6013]AOZ75513.1 MFS transporter [Clostridium pasteurianum DSM 525 = ATCC 6013]AOZ79308.1 MFS transporter [Clostridium pasteurianum]ELP60591.1 permease [Clostridium pasteurianum DSM 525 = ATCC 6013]